MRLYHTGKIEIPEPDIHHGRANADFGPGFYMTPDKDFAYRWAGKDAVINIYELDTEGLELCEFKRDLDWFRYIFSNRNAIDTVKSDVVMGPIANDTIYDTLGLLTSGLISDEDALSILLIGPEYIQVAIKTEKAKGNLRFVTSQKIERQEKSRKQAEEEEYQELFAAAMEELDK